MSNKLILFLISIIWTFNIQASEEVVIIEEGDPIYKECMRKDRKAPSRPLAYEADCSSEYFFPDDEMGDSPDPIIQSFVLKSNDSTCDLLKYGANIMWLPEWDSQPGDNRLAITVLDSLDPENDQPKGNTTNVVDPTSPLPVTVILRTEKVAARHLTCTIQKGQ